MNFRDLRDNEVRVMMIRHMVHSGNVVAPDQLAIARAKGAELKAAGIQIAGCFSSPEPRALSTVIAVMEGMECMVPVQTDDMLHSFRPEDPTAMDLLRLEKVRLETPTYEEALFMSDKLVDITVRRGKEAAVFVRDVIATAKNADKTVLVSSHSGRIEPCIAALQDPDFKPMDISTGKNILTEGDIVEVILTTEGAVVEVNYLDRD